MSMQSDTTGTTEETTKTYQLDCTGCSFEKIVEGDLDTAYDVIDRHEDEYDGLIEDHFVDMELLGYQD